MNKKQLKEQIDELNTKIGFMSDKIHNLEKYLIDMDIRGAKKERETAISIERLFEWSTKQMAQDINNAVTDEVITSQKAKANELDRYAIPAMQALISTDPSDGSPFRIASASYTRAEAMIKERNNRTR